MGICEPGSGSSPVTKPADGFCHRRLGGEAEVLAGGLMDGILAVMLMSLKPGRIHSVWAFVLIQEPPTLNPTSNGRIHVTRTSSGGVCKGDLYKINTGL